MFCQEFVQKSLKKDTIAYTFIGEELRLCRRNKDDTVINRSNSKKTTCYPFDIGLYARNFCDHVDRTDPHTTWTLGRYH